MAEQVATKQIIVTETETHRKMRSMGQLLGLGAGIYLANKQGKGAWGYIGYGLLGIIAGNIAGGLIGNVLEKK